MQTKLCRICGNKKKNLPSNKEDMLESFNIDRVVQSNYYSALVEKTHVEARDLISKMTANSQQFGIRTDHTTRKVNDVMHSNIETQLSKLTSLVRQVALGQVRQSRVCGICGVPEHSTDMCPQFQEDSAPRVNAI
jgi:hypothetical protein